MSVHSDLDMMIVLDAVADDLEDLEEIRRIVNSATVIGWRHVHPARFTNQELVPALMRSIRLGLVRAYVLDHGSEEVVPLPLGEAPSLMGEAWFGLTKKGRLIHTNWEPPTSSDEGAE